MRLLFPLLAVLASTPALAEFITASRLNLRASASADGNVLAKLPINTEVEVLEPGPMARVRVRDPFFFRGFEGYLASEHLGPARTTLDDARAKALAATSDEDALSWWQRAAVLSDHDPAVEERVAKAYEKLGRNEDAKWMREHPTTSSSSKPGLAALSLSYFPGGGAGVVRRDVLTPGCPKIDECLPVWTGGADTFHVEQTRCTKGDPSALSAPAVERWWSDVVGERRRRGKPKLVRGLTVDIDLDGTPDELAVVEVPAPAPLPDEDTYSQPSPCTRTLIKRAGAWEPLTATPCGGFENLEKEELVGAMRVLGEDHLLLLFSVTTIGAHGAELRRVVGDKTERVGPECGGNG